MHVIRARFPDCLPHVTLVVTPIATAFFWLCVTGASALAQSSSAPAILQLYEARWTTIENRMADIHAAGYGRLWLPPPSRAESGNHSVGYDVYDRFDLGSPRNETLYGTKTGLKTMIEGAHNAGVLVNTDFVPNHNGFAHAGTVDDRGTPTTADDVSFVEAGGYPGFVLTLPNDTDGDYHGAYESGEQEFRLSGLIDIDQAKNHQFIRHPVDPGNPQNIPAGTSGVFGRPPANIPTPTNAQFYPDQGLGGQVVFDATMNQNITLYDFNTNDPLAGDAIAENALGLIMRNARWMVQEVGVDGFRIDAARHFPRWVLNYLDQAMFLADKDTLLDGSPHHVFTFIETGYDSPGFIQGFIRKNIHNGNLGQVGGNRDALDFNLFGALHGNLTSNGFANNWHNIRNASIDLNDDGLVNGSQGVSFAQSHDELGPYLQNVAYAYTLMRPGNAIVYTNAREFGNGRDFPRGGKDDALGGVYGDTITTLVELRNSHGRGDFHERWIDDAFNPTSGFSNIYVYERENSALVALNSRNDSFVETRSGVQTAFAPGTVLVELTGNAADPTVDAAGNIPDAIRVDGAGKVSLSIPSNAGHGRGYVIYGVAPPQGTLSVINAASTLPGATPTPGTNGTARLADIDVVTSDSFSVRLDTTPVTLPTPAGETQPYRDVHADGDAALIKIDEGMDLNNNGAIDTVTPGDVAYGFESFTGTNTPGYIYEGGTNVGTGTGHYEQTIDATQLSEGRHYITVRAFRHRDAATGGDGGPAVFTDFRRTIYIDRLPPESEVVSFEPFASDPGNPNNRDLILGSVDKTADNMHVFLDLGAEVTDEEILQMIGSGSATEYYDRDQRIRGYLGVKSGNHVVTVVTFEVTGNVNVQRFVGIETQTNVGLGFGDVSGDGFLRANDVSGAGSFEEVLLSQNAQFDAAADSDGNGLVDNRDLFALGQHIVANTTDARVFRAYEHLLAERADLNSDGSADVDDLVTLYANMGTSDWMSDLDVDGVVDLGDARVLVVDLLRTSPADFNLDGVVDIADYTLWRDNIGTTTGVGDANFDGVTDTSDYQLWKAQFGTQRVPLSPAASSAISASIPEPTSAVLLLTLVSFTVYKHRIANNKEARVISR